MVLKTIVIMIIKIRREKNRMKRTGIWMALALALIAGPLFSADTTDDKTKELEQKVEALQKQIDTLQAATVSTELEEIRRQVAILADEVQKLRSGEEEETELDSAKRMSLGLGPSASKVYSKKQGVSLAGYGEMLYQNFAETRPSLTGAQPSGGGDQIDFLRAVLYAGYRFNDRFLFNSEMEFEHATSGEGSEALGEVSVEFAHIDFRINKDLILRGGLILMPMGFINEFHEPNVYLGARRPLTETTIIPSTWRENGFGIVGRSGIVDYRAYLVNGLNAAGFASDGWSEGRQDGSNAKIHPAFVARVDVTPAAGVLLGGSIYGGNSGFFGEESGASAGSQISENKSFLAVLGEVHGQYSTRGWDFRALYASGSVDNVAELNKDLGLQGEASIGESMAGGYVQAGYDLFARRNGTMSLIPYVRFEKTNTQKSVPAGFEKDPALDLTLWTLGLEFKPIPNIVIKADYQNADNPENSAIDQFNIAMGYSF